MQVCGSWVDEPRCPPWERLCRLRLSYHDFAGEAQPGTLVVDVRAVPALTRIFEKLFLAGFPIGSMRPIDEFDGDDRASMAANNCSAFNFRLIEGQPRLSHHSLGIAVDINPLQNPMVLPDRTEPPEGAAFLNRQSCLPGMILRPGVVVRAFEAEGWCWGGDWPDLRDYHHFSALPREATRFDVG